ncbi:phage holin, lambda family [Carnimonas bestiolae]|uniref:phage holin, lambda family n=1 Tax=Carnimonas bestiolae TaxID=3402172 RepID=UPI003EDC47F3
MPIKDPDMWRVIINVLQTWMPQIYASGLAFIIGLLRALLNGGKFIHSMLEAMLCGCLTLAAFPLLDYFGLNTYLAVAIGAAISFLGVDWFREHLATYLSKWIERDRP